MPELANELSFLNEENLPSLEGLESWGRNLESQIVALGEESFVGRAPGDASTTVQQGPPTDTISVPDHASGIPAVPVLVMNGCAEHYQGGPTVVHLPSADPLPVPQAPPLTFGEDLDRRWQEMRAADPSVTQYGLLLGSQAGAGGFRHLHPINRRRPGSHGVHLLS